MSNGIQNKETPGAKRWRRLCNRLASRGQREQRQNSIPLQRLAEVQVDARVLRSLPIVKRLVSGDGDDGQLGVILPKQRRKLPTVHVGQANVEQHDVGTKIGHGFCGREGGFAYLGRMAGRRDPNRDQIRRIAVVFDNENSQGLHALPNKKATAGLPAVAAMA